MEVTQALKLNGYKLAGHGHGAEIYRNGRGLEMRVIPGRNGDITLGSTNVKALDFIIEILNGAHAG